MTNQTDVRPSAESLITLPSEPCDGDLVILPDTPLGYTLGAFYLSLRDAANLTLDQQMWRELAYFVLSKRGKIVYAASLKKLIIRRFAGVMDYVDFDNPTMDRLDDFAKANVARFMQACRTGTFEALAAA